MTTAVETPNVLCEPSAAYHARDAVSFHRLEDFIASPRWFWAYHVERCAKADQESDALDFGTGNHAWVLQPERFEEEVALIPEDVLAKNGARTTNRYKEWVAEHNPDGKPEIKPDKWEEIKRIRRAIMAHPLAGELIRRAEYKEITLTWCCERTDLARKSRLDLITTFPPDHEPREYAGRPVIADLKSTSDHTPTAFARRALDLRYHRQAAFYMDAFAACIDAQDKPIYCLILVNTSPPYFVRVREIEGDELALGHYEVDMALKDMARRFQSGDWSEEGENDLRAIQYPRYAFSGQ